MSTALVTFINFIFCILMTIQCSVSFCSLRNDINNILMTKMSNDEVNLLS